MNNFYWPLFINDLVIIFCVVKITNQDGDGVGKCRSMGGIAGKPHFLCTSSAQSVAGQSWGRARITEKIAQALKIGMAPKKSPFCAVENAVQKRGMACEKRGGDCRHKQHAETVSPPTSSLRGVRVTQGWAGLAG